MKNAKGGKVASVATVTVMPAVFSTAGVDLQADISSPSAIRTVKGRRDNFFTTFLQVRYGYEIQKIIIT